MADLLDPTEIMFTPFEPKTMNRYIMYIEGIPAYLIKTASRPKITFEEVTLEHMNVTRYVKGKGKWDVLSIELYDSKSYQLGYLYESKKGYFISGSYFKQNNKVNVSRSLLISQDLYKAKHDKENDISEFKIILGKDFKWDTISLQLYAEWAEGTIKSAPFTETVNDVNNQYEIENINYRSVNPSLLLKKRYQFNDHTFQVSSLFQSNSTNLDKYFKNIELDTLQEGIKLQKEMSPFEDLYMEIKLSYIYKRNIYANYSFSKKGDADMNSLEFGLLF